MLVMDTDITTRLLLDTMIRSLTGEDIDDAADPMEDEIDCCKQDKNGISHEDQLDEFLDQEDNEDEAQRNLLLALMMSCVCEEEEKRVQQNKNQRRPSSAKKVGKKKAVIPRTRLIKFFADPTTGILRPMTPKLSAWWINYIQDPAPQSPQWSKLFRSRFRLPYKSFKNLLQLLNDEGGELFARWTTTMAPSGDGRRRRGGPISKISPIELLLLGSLRFLGRGWTFDDLQEATFIHQEVHRVFFHKFIEFGATIMYPKYVKMPATLKDMEECEGAYKMAGFPGCIGSTDATHVVLEKVSYSQRQEHLGFKSSCTTRTYNLTVNHKRQILHSTQGHPGRWNDKTLVRFDNLVEQLRNGSFNDTMSFELFKATGEKVKFSGAYVIVDNGYLEWSVTVPPLKNSSFRAEIRFSQWLESLRKDVECTFGILKGRWRILKTGIRLHNTGAADNIWLTCCALHNLLLDVDGLSEGWQSGIPSYWEMPSGQQEQEFDIVDNVPNAIQKLVNPQKDTRFLQHDTYSPDDRNHQARTGYNDYDMSFDDKYIERQECGGKAINVNSISLKRFRQMLIEHFNFVFHKEMVLWPTRLSTKPRDVPNFTL